MYKKAVFSIEGFDKAFIGYTDGTRWNGWAEPFFEIDEAFTIMQKNNVDGATPIFYMEETDSFIIVEEEPYAVKGRNFTTEDGIKHLYGIGAGCWVWDEEIPKDMALTMAYRYLEVDTLYYNLVDVENLAKVLEKRLQDTHKLRDAVTIWLDKDLTMEEEVTQWKDVLKWKY